MQKEAERDLMRKGMSPRNAKEEAASIKAVGHLVLLAQLSELRMMNVPG